MPTTKTYSTLGRCMYCGAQIWSTTSKRKLGDEHIIPEGLGGRLILPEASCQICEEITSKVELEWLRGSFHVARVQKGLGKKKKRPPSFLPLKILKSGREIWKKVPIEKFPALVVTLVFDPPSILSTSELIEKQLAGGVAVGNLPSFGLHLKEYLEQGTVSIVPPRVTATSEQLGRMLAKIAHSYAVAEVGINGFKPYLLEIICGTDLRYLSCYVGGTKEIPQKIDDTYLIRHMPIQLPDGRKCLMVTIRLLADLQGMPEYRVVVGEIQ